MATRGSGEGLFRVNPVYRSDPNQRAKKLPAHSRGNPEPGNRFANYGHTKRQDFKEAAKRRRGTIVEKQGKKWSGQQGVGQQSSNISPQKKFNSAIKRRRGNK